MCRSKYGRMAFRKGSTSPFYSDERGKEPSRHDACSQVRVTSNGKSPPARTANRAPQCSKSPYRGTLFVLRPAPRCTG